VSYHFVEVHLEQLFCVRHIMFNI